MSSICEDCKYRSAKHINFCLIKRKHCNLEDHKLKVRACDGFEE